MVVIAKRSTVIPVDFGEFQLEFRANDASIKRLKEVGQEMEKRGQAIQETDTDAVFEELHDAVKSAWTELFDEAGFGRVYAFADQSTVDAMLYLIEAIAGIVAEFENRFSVETLNKYLAD